MQSGSDTSRRCEMNMMEAPGLTAIATMANVNRSIMAAIMEFNGTLFSRMTAINQQWASFIGERLTEDFKLSQRIAACRSPEQVMEVYGSFLQTAFEQYQEEFAHMLKLGQAFALQNSELLKQSLDTNLGGDISSKPTVANGARINRSNKRQYDSAA